MFHYVSSETQTCICWISFSDFHIYLFLICLNIFIHFGQFYPFSLFLASMSFTVFQVSLVLVILPISPSFQFWFYFIILLVFFYSLTLRCIFSCSRTIYSLHLLYSNIFSGEYSWFLLCICFFLILFDSWMVVVALSWIPFDFPSLKMRFSWTSYFIRRSCRKPEWLQFWTANTFS